MSGDSGFDALVDAYADGTIAEADLQALQAALRADAGARQRFWRRQRLHAQLGAACRAASGAAEARPGPVIRPRWLAAAAVLVAALGAGWAWWPAAGTPRLDGRRLTVGEAFTGPAVLTWDDGSRIIVDAGGRCRAGDNRMGPALSLDQGCLSAEIARQARDRRFSIATPDATATVLGTAFELATDGAVSRLAVEHGVVRLADRHGSVEARAGDCAATGPAGPGLVGRRLAVAPDGDDGADGSTRHPWRTLARAAGALAPGDCLVIRGTWHEPLVLRHGGAPGLPVTICGDDAAIDGADELTGWTRRPDGLWSAPADGTLATPGQPFGNDQLIIDGAPAPLAAWPDAGAPAARFGNAGIPGPGREPASTARGSGYLSGLPDQSLDGAAVWWRTPDGRVGCGRLLGRAGGSIEFTFRWDMPGHPVTGAEARLFAAPALADQPGEWTRDGEGRVLVRLADGDRPDRHRIALQRRRAGILVAASSIRVRGIDLRTCGIQIGPAAHDVRLSDLVVGDHAAGWWPDGDTPLRPDPVLGGASMERIIVDGFPWPP